ncbi:MAG: Gfo/Idh/MocA family oxidoreductase [Planctomycetota bacterium]
MNPAASHSLQTRRFFLGSLAAGAASMAVAPRVMAAATEEVRIAVLGAGGRGGQLAKAISKCSHAKLSMVCDPDPGRAESVASKLGATASTDLRAALDDANVDAVVITTCNHWHCLAALWAIDAGKDVYVEKPLSHSQWEGMQVVLAAEASDRIVQLGTQQRTDPIQAEARQYLHEDQSLGAIQYVQASRLGPRGSIGKRDTPLAIDESIDYDLWLGPAQDQPIFRNQLHYDWHWDWNTGSGEMGNWGVHILDDVRNVAYQDSVSTPSRIVAAGGRVAWNDAGQTPNVHMAVFETDSFPTLIALSNLPSIPDGKGGFKVNAGRPVTGAASGYVIACEGGYYLGQRGSGRAVDRDGNVLRQFRADVDTVTGHVQNFVDAVRTRDEALLNAPIRNGHYSTGWCNLANIGFRAAGSYDGETLQSASDVSAWHRLIEEMTAQLEPFGVGAGELSSSSVLTHDPETETFVGPLAESANRFLKRQYRPGYEVPDVASGKQAA